MLVSEGQCMVHDFGPPTPFLALSCAEYESPDIIDYMPLLSLKEEVLGTVNHY